MYIRNKGLTLIFRILLTAGCAYGLLVSSDAFHGGLTVKMLAYYTNLSNIICFAYILAATAYTAAGFALRRDWGASPLPGLKRAFTLMIAVTLVVYHFILAPAAYRMNLNYEVYSLPDILLHYFTPMMFIADWLLFDEKNKTRWYDPLLWLLIPIVYLCYVLIRAETAQPLNADGARYPYYFLDLDILTVKEVTGYVFLCVAAFTALGYVFVLIDRLPAVWAYMKTRRKY